MKPPPPSGIEDLQKLGKESRENIDRAMQEIATLEKLLDLIEKIPEDERTSKITLPVLTSMAKRLENLRKEGEGNDELHKRVEDAALKIFELCTSIPEVHDHLTSATMQEKLEDTDERMQMVDEAFGLIVLYPEQAEEAGIRTQEHRKALVDVLLDPKVLSTLCGRILANENPLTKANEHRNCALRFLVLVLKRQEKLLNTHPDKILTTYSMKDWLLLIRPAVFTAYESSHRTLQKEDIKKTIQEIIGKEKWVTDWDRRFLQEDLDRLKNVKPEFFAEAEDLKKYIAGKIFSQGKEGEKEPEDLMSSLERLLQSLIIMTSAGYAVSILRLAYYREILDEFVSLQDMILGANNAQLKEAVQKRVEKMAKKLKVRPTDVWAMLESEEFRENIVRRPFEYLPKSAFKQWLNNFKVYPFTIRYRGANAAFVKTIDRFNMITLLLRKFEYPRRPIEDVKDLAQESMTYVVEYLSNSFVKVDPLTGKIDPGFGRPIVPLGPRRR